MPRTKLPSPREAHEAAVSACVPASSSVAWWLWLAILTPLLCFLASVVALKSWSTSIHEAARSITTNGSPSVAYLATALDDAQRIERRTMLARPEALPVDRGVIAELEEDFDRAVAAELATPNYPGEAEASRVMRERSAAFFAAVADLLAGEDSGRAPDAAARDRVERTGDALFTAIRAVIGINEHAVETAGRQIDELQGRSALRDALALICVLAGTALGIGGARRYLLAAKLRSRLDAERAAELDIFAGRVAHDLCSPLQAIQMRAWLGARAQTPEGSQCALAHIGEQTQRMKGIIDALLAFARAAAHPDPSSRSDVTAVVTGVVTEAQLPAAEAQIELVVEPLPAATVACDPSVLAIILSNLVRNAIKYIGGGSQGVRRITVRERFQDRSLLLEVEDTGPGLPPGAEARVFDPFVRVAGPRAPDGIGLGLATVKRLVEANQGEVGVESQPGHGCCFWFTLPLAA